MAVVDESGDVGGFEAARRELVSPPEVARFEAEAKARADAWRLYPSGQAAAESGAEPPKKRSGRRPAIPTTDGPVDMLAIARKRLGWVEARLTELRGAAEESARLETEERMLRGMILGGEHAAEGDGG